MSNIILLLYRCSSTRSWCCLCLRSLNKYLVSACRFLFLAPTFLVPLYHNIFCPSMPSCHPHSVTSILSALVSLRIFPCCLTLHLLSRCITVSLTSPHNLHLSLWTCSPLLCFHALVSTICSCIPFMAATFCGLQYCANVSWQSLEARTLILDPWSSILEAFEYRGSSRVLRVSRQETKNFSRD